MLDLLITLIKCIFDQPKVQGFLNLECFLIQSTTSAETADEKIIEFISDIYGDEIDVHALQVERAVLTAILSDNTISCFYDI